MRASDNVHQSPPFGIAKQRSSGNIAVNHAAKERRRISIQAREHERVGAAALQHEKRLASKKLTSSKYPKSEILLLKQVFDTYDVDESGSLERSELLQALKEQKMSVTRVKCGKKTLEERQAEKGLVKGQAPGTRGVFLVDFADSLFRVLDANNDQRVEFQELLRLLYPLASEAEMSTMLHWVAEEKPMPEVDDHELTDELRNEIHSMFRLYDKDRSGTITPAEFQQAMRRCGLSAEEMDEMFAEADVNESGEIDLEEFTQMMWHTISYGAKLTHGKLYGSR